MAVTVLRPTTKVLSANHRVMNEMCETANSALRKTLDVVTTHFAMPLTPTLFLDLCGERMPNENPTEIFLVAVKCM